MLITIFGDNENGEISANDRLSLCFEIFFFFCQKFYKIILCVIIFIERKRERVELVKVVKRNENFNILMYIVTIRKTIPFKFFKNECNILQIKFMVCIANLWIATPRGS